MDFMSRDKSEKFVELANKRVNKAIKDLKLIANLSNRQNYSYSDVQVKKIIKALQVELDYVKQSFVTDEEEPKDVFKL